MYHDGRQKFLVTHGADATVAHDLDDGSEIWRLGGMNGPSAFHSKSFDGFFRFVGSPTAVPGTIIIPTAKWGPTFALTVDDSLRGRIDRPGPHIRWINEKTPDVCCPLIVDGLVYHVRKSGQVFCVDLATGEELYLRADAQPAAPLVPGLRRRSHLFDRPRRPHDGPQGGADV